MSVPPALLELSHQDLSSQDIQIELHEISGQLV